MAGPVIAKRLEISGVVQGVGFRPFLFSLAEKYGLKGEVSNTSAGVSLVLEGAEQDIDLFSADLVEKTPLLASVTGIETFRAAPQNFSSFQITDSRSSGSRATLISPDVTVCPDCLSEMQDPSDRRFEYPFINCTNCGPRFTIIEDIPYDRPRTSMKGFEMCPACRAEYDDPRNRRFHAQPNACPVCGPEAFLTDREGRRISAGTGAEGSGDAVSLAARFLGEGRIVAVKGLGGFHLACDAENEEAVNSLRLRKNRPHKPFALMAASDSVLFDHVHVSETEKALLNSYHRPIVILRKKEAGQSRPGGLAKGVAPFNPCLGIMLPYTPLHYLLLEKGPSVLVMTSGNRSGEPLSIDNEDALEAFAHIADYFLLHNRDIYFRADDSIVRVQAGKPRFLRRSRGYAPLPLVLDQRLPEILACGAGLKNTICLTRENQAFLSQHIGDLFNVKTHEFYKACIHHLKKITDIEPVLMAHDLHPGYMSTAWALEQTGVKKKGGVQHHHAHAAACMAENGLDGPVLAITLDGTGYGTDGHIWGGEILLCHRAGFRRKAHLSYVRMPGGDAAVREPWRMAASILYEAFGREFLNLDLPYIKEMDREKLDFVVQMMEKNLNCPLTSSCGRLFDAVASLLCVRHEITHESQAAMELEALAHESISRLGLGGKSLGGEDLGGSDLDNEGLGGESYDFRLIGPDPDDPEKSYRIDFLPAVRQMTADIQSGRSPSAVSLRFHHTLVEAFTAAAKAVSRETGVKTVVLSGGVFINDLIFTRMINRLEKEGFTVYTHTQAPTGDGGISLGQAVVAAALEG